MINDLFPGMDCPRVQYPELSAALRHYLETHGFHGTNEEVYNFQVDKAIQVYETQMVRHTTQIVGPTGGGKTVVLDALAAAREPAQNVIIKQFIINPVSGVRCAVVVVRYNQRSLP